MTQQLWFRKTDRSSAIESEDFFREENCRGWNACEHADRIHLARDNCARLNAAQWSRLTYKIIGWRNEGEMK